MVIILSGRCLSVRYIVIACGSGAESVLEKVVIVFAAYTEGFQLLRERAISSSSFIRLLCFIFLFSLLSMWMPRYF